MPKPSTKRRPKYVTYDARELGPGRVNQALIDSFTEEDIERMAAEDDAGEIWGEMRLVPPIVKQPITIRIDDDILAWFKAQGARYQTKMNRVLRTYVTAMKAKVPKAQALDGKRKPR
ncbi:MAG: BrnA antitoxin family protein [Gemmatimonadaceae bacterium]